MQGTMNQLRKIAVEVGKPEVGKCITKAIMCIVGLPVIGYIS